jgi:peptidoglycan LD-endopeptidase LytH
MSSKIFVRTFTLVLLLTQNSFSQNNICSKWNKLDSLITNQLIDSDDAEELMKEYEPKVKKYFRQMKGAYVSRYNWVFPLKNFTSIYYRDYGNDYWLRSYDYFQGSESKGHPAHDIMILDVNKDLLDDSTLKPVDVVSMSSGVVVATDTTWTTGSKLRGGKYVKIFDVTNDGIFYYSHLSEVNVKPGEVINPGDKIGEVGRTGRKAVLAEGKTHVHVSFFKSEDGYPKPEDILDDLRNAERRNSSDK